MSDVDRAPRTAREVLARGRTFLERKGVDASRLDAELLVAHALGLDRLHLFLELERPVSQDELDHARQLLVRRAKGEPVAHLVGVREFYGRDFVVNADVLIPRPETELLVDLVRERVAPRLREPEPGAEHPQSQPSQEGAAPATAHGRDEGAAQEAQSPNEAQAPNEHRSATPTPSPTLRIADLGTGSGCLAVTLALELPDAEVVASDVSPEALVVAQNNAQRLGAQVRFVQGDRLTPLLAHGPFDWIVSNPPYVDVAAELAPEVREHEPSLALFAPKGDPDHFALLLAREGLALVRPGGGLLVELGFDQAERLVPLLEPQGLDLHLHDDLAGVQRVLEIRKPG